MLIPNQLVEVKVIGVTLNHYRNLGYDVNMFDTIMVPPEHLTNGSKCKVDVICDICSKKISRTYKEYLKHHTNDIDTCNKCKTVKSIVTCNERYGVDNPMLSPKIKDKLNQTVWDKYEVKSVSELNSVKEKKRNTCMEHYGVENPGQSQEIKEKSKRTCLDRYGCENPMQNQEVRAKAEQTNLMRYGVKNPNQSDVIREKTKATNLNKYGVENVFQSNEIQNKIAETNLEKYGAENPFASEEIKNKIVATNLQKYGVEYFSQTEEFLIKRGQTNIKRYGYESPMKNIEIKEKSIKTMYEHGTQKTSTQQLKVYEMIKNKHPDVILNYPFSSLSLDIFVEINNVKIDIEYDGWFFHQDKQKDIKRDKFLQSQGFKTLRIRSGHLLPTEQELFDAIDYLVNTEHHFKEIVLSDWKKVDKYESLFDSAAV